MLVTLKAAEQCGQITTRQLNACGLDNQAIASRVRRGWLHPVYRGVYAVGHPPLTIEGRLMAAVLACGERAYVSHHSGSALLGFMTWEDRPLEVTVVGASARRIEGIRAHRARSLHWRDTYRHHGIPVTSPARTLLDLAAVLPEPALRSAARRAQALHRVSVRQLLEVVNRSNGHPGTGALRAIVGDGPVPTRSDLEDALLDLLDAAGIERPEVNAPLSFDGVTVIPTSSGATAASRSKPTAAAGTSTSSYASTMPTSRRSSKLTPIASSACPGRR